MKRKVIKQGNGTLTITLPKKWTQELGLTGESEVEVEASRNSLIISSSHEAEKRSISVDADEFERHSYAKFIIACYEQGFDTIDLVFTKSKIKSWSFGEENRNAVINFFVNRLIGFEIMSQTKRGVTIGNVAEKHVKFQSILSRIFFLTEECLINIIDAFESKDYSQIKNWQTGHDSIAKLVALASRILYESESCSKVELTNYITILSILDKVADFIKYANRYTLLYDRNVSQSTINLAKKSLKFMGLYRSFFNKFEYASINEFDDLRGEIKKTYLDCIKKHPKESAINSNFDAIVETLNGAVKPRIAIHLDNEFR